MEFAYEPLVRFWRSFGDWGFILVLAGVVGEVLTAVIDSTLERKHSPAHRTWEPRLKRYEVVAGWILIIGLAMEYQGHKNETVLLDLNNSLLGQDASQAIERASTANKEAQRFRVKADELEAKTKPRMITETQVTNFIFLTRFISKIPVTVSVGQEGFDTTSFSFQLREMLSKAGFEKKEDGPYGVKSAPNRFSARYIGQEPEVSDVLLVVPPKDVTNSSFQVTLPTNMTNGFKCPIVTSTNEMEIMAGIYMALPQIGISVKPMSGENWAVSGYEFFVPIKYQY